MSIFTGDLSVLEVAPSRRNQLERKLVEYRKRVKEKPTNSDARIKEAVLCRVLDRRVISFNEIYAELRAERVEGLDVVLAGGHYMDGLERTVFENAWGVINDYILTGGGTNTNSPTGLPTAVRAA